MEHKIFYQICRFPQNNNKGRYSVRKVIYMKNNNIKSLVAYLVAGDPNMDDTLSLMHGFVDAGVDVIVGEGFEAGGHNGQEETTTMCLIPHVSENIDILKLSYRF